VVDGVERFNDRRQIVPPRSGDNRIFKEFGRIDLAWGSPGPGLVEDDVETVEVLNEDWDTWKQA
jgi:hypothetical protein